MFGAAAAVQDCVAGGFHGRHVVVVGDAMVDRYLWGEVTRISPEAPVPVVRLTKTTSVAGGAANVAANLAGLGCRTTLCAAVGHDAGRDELLGLITACGITPALVAVPGFPTIIKTRVIGGHQQMVRIDAEEPRHCDAAAIAQLTAAAVAAIATADAVILSDYAKGVIHATLAQAVIAAARAKHIPVLVDPKGADWRKYAGATTVTPNTGELILACGVSAHDHAALVAGGARLRADLQLDFLTFTRGEHGIALIEAERTVMVAAQAREVFDVSGAGDTVIATMAASLAAGLTPEDAMRLANVAAGIVVGKIGTVPIQRAELAVAINDHALPAGKICALAAACAQVERWRAAGDTVVFTNGCFDILHAGHVHYLERARACGDRLVLGLNTDDSIRRLKGPSRPVNPTEDRAAVLAGLACIDLVVPFSEDTPLTVVTALKPMVLVKGADYRPEHVVGGAEVTAWGGRVVLVDLLPGRSTTAILQRSKE